MKNLQELSIEIKKKCIEKRTTQRAIVEYLKENGYPNMREPLLSSILNGHYNFKMASEVINAIWNYLNDTKTKDMA